MADTGIVTGAIRKVRKAGREISIHDKWYTLTEKTHGLKKIPVIHENLVVKIAYKTRRETNIHGTTEICEVFRIELLANEVMPADEPVTVQEEDYSGPYYPIPPKKEK